MAKPKDLVVKGGALPYPGSANSVSGRLVKLFPPHKHYASPFGGMDSTFWAHPGTEKYTIGDINKDTIDIWRGLKDGTLMNRMEQIQCIPARMDLVDRALKKRSPIANIYLWKVLFQGKTKYPSIPKRLRGKEVCFSRQLRNRPKIEEKVQSVNLNHGTWESTVDKADSPSTFFFLDPPWKLESGVEDQTRYYGKNAVVDFDAIYNRMAGIKGKFMLYCQFDDTLAEDAKQHGFHTYRVKSRGHAHKDSRKGYLIATNYPVSFKGSKGK